MSLPPLLAWEGGGGGEEMDPGRTRGGWSHGFGSVRSAADIFALWNFAFFKTRTKYKTSQQTNKLNKRHWIPYFALLISKFFRYRVNSPWERRVLSVWCFFDCKELELYVPDRLKTHSFLASSFKALFHNGGAIRVQLWQSQRIAVRPDQLPTEQTGRLVFPRSRLW